MIHLGEVVNGTLMTKLKNVKDNGERELKKGRNLETVNSTIKKTIPGDGLFLIATCKCR